MISIIICDDDRAFASQLKKQLEKAMADRNLKAKVYALYEAEAIGEETISACDIAFLDIDFEGKKYNGIDIAKKLRRLRQDAVIVFVTNYVEYAPEGYEVQAFRYILKNEVSQKLSANMDKILSKLKTSQSCIKIVVDGELIDIPIKDILYIESLGHTINVHVLQGESLSKKVFSCYSTLKNMQNDLDSRGFLRIHKSYLINMAHIKKLNCSETLLDDGSSLRVSSRSYAECKKKFMLWRGQQ